MLHRLDSSLRGDRRLWLVGLAILVLVTLVVPFRVSQAVGETVTVTAPATAMPGDQFTVSVNVGSVTNLGGFSLSVTYDPNVLTGLSAADPDDLFLGSVPGLVSVIDASVDNVAGEATGIAARGNPGVDGSGTLITFQFEVNAGAAPGNTALGIQQEGSALLADANAQPIAGVTTQGATIDIQGGGGGNTPPTITDVGNQTILQDAATSVLNFIVGDAQDAAGSLTVTGTSSNTTLVPNNPVNITLGGAGTANRTVQITPAAGQTGTATITLTVTDNGGLTATDLFTVTVSAPGGGANTLTVTAPATAMAGDQFTVSVNVGSVTNLGGFSLSVTYDPNVLTGLSAADPEDLFLGSVPGMVSVIDASVDNVAGEATGIAARGNPGVTGSGTLITFQFEVNAGAAPGNTALGIQQEGSALLADANAQPIAGVTTQGATIDIQAGGGNTAPTITNVGNQTITQDTSTAVLGFTVDDAQDAVGTLTVTGTSSNPTLVPNNAANITFLGLAAPGGANRAVQVTPAAGQTGTATITLTVTDSGGLTATDPFTVTVTSSGGPGPGPGNTPPPSPASPIEPPRRAPPPRRSPSPSGIPKLPLPTLS